jgi:hypothetical protein
MTCGTRLTGPVVNWSSWRAARLSRHPGTGARRDCRGRGAANPVYGSGLWVGSEIRGFWDSKCRRFAHAKGRHRYLFSMRTKSAGGPQSGQSLPRRPGHELVRMPVRHGPYGAGPVSTAQLSWIVRHRVQLICPAPQGKLTSDNRDSPAKLRFDVVAGQGPYRGNRAALTLVNGRCDCWYAQARASRKGLPGQRVMAQNRAIDGIGRHRNSLLRVRRNGRRCDGSPVNR